MAASIEPEFLGSLNPQQHTAATAPAGPLMILAGPGSGKTSVVTARVGYLVTCASVHPRSIALVTFTRKAATEMEQRLRDLIGAPADGVTVGTFHSVSLLLLRRNRSLAGRSGSGSIVEEGTKKGILDRLLREDADGFSATPAALAAMISREKGCERRPEDTKTAKEAGDGDPATRRMLARIYAA